VVVFCQAGDRSSIGYSILARNGYKNIKNYGGGMSEWINKGNPVVTD
jgi:hydroxyacylglutathione hydrolase